MSSNQDNQNPTMNLNQLAETLNRLGEMFGQYQQADQLPALLQEAVQESLLQRFEYTLEIAWKSGKRYLVEGEGYDKEMGPRTVLRLCGELGLLKAENWLLYLQARQNIAHDYNRQKAEMVLDLITDFYADVRHFYAVLQARLLENNEP